MPWVRVDDRFNEHPKLAAVGPAGWGVWLAGLAYCNRNLTDGFIPYAVAEGIGGAWTVRLPDGEAWRLRRARAAGAGLGTALESGFVIGLLVAHGLWAEVPGGYRIHDYADYQPSKAAVLDGRERTRQRVERHRTGADPAPRRAEHDRGNGAAGDGRGMTNARRNGVTAGPVTPAPVPGPVPMPGPPSRPGGRSGGARPTAADRDRERLVGLVAELTGRRGGLALERGFGALAAEHLARHGWPALEPAYRAVAAVPASADAAPARLRRRRPP